MSPLAAVSTEKRYPLLYWVTVAYLVGVPNFVHFDATGRTANAINLTSISTIVLACLTGYLLTFLLLFDRYPLLARPIRHRGWLWMILLVELLIASVLRPESRLTATTATSSLLTCFRLGQWVIAFCLVVALYSRTPAEEASRLVVRLIGRVSWLWLGLIWTLLPILPSQVFGGSDDASEQAVRRLGGQLLHPAHVALLSSAAFFYALFFFRSGPRKWAACVFAFLSLLLTQARAQQAGFLLALGVYTLILSRKAIFRWGAAFVAVAMLPIGIALSSNIMKYIGRGQSAQSLASLNDRTRIWQASFAAIAQHPLFGYGYSVGARSAIRDYWHFAHWIPPHAHNEFIEIALDGGIFALAVLLYFYGAVLWNGLRLARRNTLHLFVFLVFAQFCLNTLTGSEFSYQYLGSGGILLLICISVLDESSAPLSAATTASPERRRPWGGQPLEVPAA